ncbi:MAG: acyl-CoA thioesterase [Acidimicrobiia bacterium]
MGNLPDVLVVDEAGAGEFTVRHPTDDPEGRDVVFSGQVLAQMIMAADKTVNSEKDVKSVYAIFARAGTYTKPMELQLETMHSGRAWASHTITSTQGGKLMARALVLMNSVEKDLMRHGPAMPDVPGPEKLASSGMLTYPGLDNRPIDDPNAVGPDGTPALRFWMKLGESYDSVAANQAILAWSQPGMIIGLAMRPHRDKVNIGDAHRTISTGVISHTVHFHERFDIGQWLLVSQQAHYAGNGRVFGTGQVFTQDGLLVSTFEQDAMARGVEGELDPKRAM